MVFIHISVHLLERLHKEWPKVALIHWCSSRSIVYHSNHVLHESVTFSKPTFWTWWLQVWKDAGAHLIYHWIVPSTRRQQSNHMHSAFAQGICLAYAEDKGVLLCVGTSSGVIYVFKVGHGGDSFEMIKELDGHQGPVLCLGSSFHSNRCT